MLQLTEIKTSGFTPAQGAEDRARYSALLCQGYLDPSRPVTIYAPASADTMPVTSKWTTSKPPCRDYWAATFELQD